ncbi:dixin-like isoform X2 [Dendronephthya gigantea]|nr:dixin-like isoform X2 [Dendronephthya gigantea]
MQAYVAWTNSQLKKLPGCKVIEDLARDMQDGVALAQLIEVVAGEKIEIDPEPASPLIMKDNVEKILLFISARKIRLHHVTAKDIVSGNMKAIMRLILALAAHFKPSSVRSAAPEPARPGRRIRRSESSLSAVAADAAAALHDVSRAAASAGTPYKGSRFRPSKLLNSSESTSSIDSNEPKALQPDQSMSTKIPVGGPPNKLVKRTGKLRIDALRKSTSPAENRESGLGNTDSGDGGKALKKRVAIGCRQWKEIVEGYGIMEEDVKETRKKLIALQDLLLNQEPETEQSGDEGDFSSLDGTLLQEQITILNARLDQRSSEYDDLKNELNRTREECINLQGIKQGLQTRLTDQEQVMMKLKAELLKLGFSHQTTNSDKDELQRILEERDREIALLRSQLASKDDQVDQQKKELDKAFTKVADVNSIEKDLRAKIKKHEVNAGALRTQVKELQQKLKSVDASEVKLSNRITYQDRRVALLENKVLREQERSKIDGMDTVRQCLLRLRSSLSSQDPQRHTLDMLEETLTNMIDTGFVQFPTNDVIKASPRNNNYQNGIGSPREKDVTKSTGTDVTRITYQPSWSPTPSVVIISKRLGEVTLGDFKSLLDLSGQYRYYFKALDAEFGTIREELINDDDVIPGWEGKIMAWISDSSDEEKLRDGDSSTLFKTKRSETDI